MLTAKEQGLLDSLEELAEILAEMIDSINDWDSAEKADKSDLIWEFATPASDALVTIGDVKRKLQGYANV